MREDSAAPGSLETAVGLGQRNPDEPGRLPSDRPGPCGPGRRVAFVVHVHASPRTLSPAAIRGRPRHRPSWSLQAIPALALRAVRRTERARRKMPLSDFCNRLTITCTQHGPSDSRARLLAGDPLRGARRRCRSAFGRWTSGRSTGGASLDGDPPASAIAHDPFPAHVRNLSPVRSHRRGRRAILAELRSKAPPRDTSRSRRFRPRTELVTWPLTPSVATRASRRCLGPSVRRGPRPRPPCRQARLAPPPRQRRRTSPDQGAFHRR